MAARACLSAKEFDAHVANDVEPSQARAIAEHLAGCAACRQRDAALRLGRDATAPQHPDAAANTQRLPPILQHAGEDATDAGQLNGTPPPYPYSTNEKGPQGLARGATVGRYVLIDLLGQGGMGSVYLAYDPQLDRRVAIKLLRADGKHGQPDVLLRARLEREAQAMARLAHPNVVAVFDEGVWNEQVYVAMEYVDGPTLAQWVAKPGRTWREILAMYVAAGRGLAAAHSAGLVHRDFKPENVMVAKNGRPKVTDFGLAHVEGGLPALPNAPVFAGLLLSSPGEVLGTPAYMAPEQFKGEALDARTDQFGFCAALYEALYGERAFEGEDFKTLGASVVRGETRPAPRGSPVPQRVRELLLRGLSVDPAARHPSLEILLQQLARDPSKKTRQVLERAALAAVACAAVGFAFWVSQREHDRCAREAASVGAFWGPSQASELRARLGAKGQGAEAEALVATLDRYVADSRTLRAATCDDARAGTIEASTADLRARCLDSALVRAATAATLVETDPAITADLVADRLHGKWGLAGCERLQSPRHHWLDERQRFQSDLTRVEVLSGLGLADQARAEAERLEKAAAAEGARSVQAAALVSWGQSYVLRQEKMEDALKLFRRAGLLAEAAGDDDTAVAAKVYMMQADSLLAHDSDADRVDEEARAALERAGNPPVWMSALDVVEGTIAIDHGSKRATELMRKAVAETEGVYGASSPMMVNAYSELGRSLASVDGDVGGAASYFLRAAAIIDANPGADREQDLNMYNNAGTCFRQADRLEEAQATLEKGRPLATQFESVWPNDVAAYLIERAMTESELGQADAATADLAHSERLAAGKEMGADNWEELHLVKSRLAQKRGAIDEAHTEAEQALQFASRPPCGEDELADTRLALAQAIAAKDPAGARKLAGQAIDRYRKGHYPLQARQLREAQAFVSALPR